MHSVSVVVAVVIVTLLMLPKSTATQGEASLILVHGKIWTENPQQPEVEAIAIYGNRIIAAGNSDAISKLKRPNTRVIDLHGRRVVPGFNDAHVHFYMGGDGLASVQLHEASSPEQFRRIIAEFVRTVPKG